jgi:AcrR family transcriptional regulator
MDDLTVRRRDRNGTKIKILLAVRQVIEQHGLEKVGINLVARTSGYNKVLVYRYFHNIDGLIDEYILFVLSKSTHFQQEADIQGTFSEILKTKLINMLHVLLDDMHLRVLLKWEMKFGKAILRKAYAESFQQTLQQEKKLLTHRDIEGMIALLSSGIYYLAVIGEYDGTIMNLDLSCDEHWKRIENLISFSVDSRSLGSQFNCTIF